MKKIITLLVTVFFLMTALAGCLHDGDDTGGMLRENFLKKADEVVISEDSVTFTDALGVSVTVKKHPQRVICLFPSYTALWYEAGGAVIGCIGGESASELYIEYIGRDITEDPGVAVVAESALGTKWDIETVIASSPDLIICSEAMNGLRTVQAPAKSAGIPLITVDYDDFSDYLKWFRVFCNLTGSEERWESVALRALDETAAVIEGVKGSEAPSVFCMFTGVDTLRANTENTVIGDMLKLLGAHNVITTDNTAVERIDVNLETLYAADPDMILVQCHTGTDAAKALIADTYGNNPVWNSLRAVKSGNIFYLDKTLFHNKPGRRFAEAYKILSGILYQEK